jgi:surface antigen
VTTTPTILKTLTALAAAALITAGCGGSTGADTATSTSGDAPSSTDAPQMSDMQAPPAQLVVDVTIKGGEATPTNAQFNAKANEPIVLRVNSDAADQLHVHSTPEHTFDVQPKNGQSFQFTVSVPGKVDIELHQLDRTIATVTVQ